MGEVARIDLETGEITEFRPEKAKVAIAKTDAIIEYAERVKDWPLLRTAVELKIQEIREFCEWWGAHVSVREKNRKLHTVHGAVSVSDAEKKTKISQQQVSRWAKALADREIARVRRQS